MGYRAHVRIVNEIEYGDSLGFEEPDDLIDEIQKLQSESDKQIFGWFDENSDDIELDYEPFIEAFEKYYNKEKYSENLKKLYDNIKEHDNLKNNGYIRIDWF